MHDTVKGILNLLSGPVSDFLLHDVLCDLATPRDLGASLALRVTMTPRFAGKYSELSEIICEEIL